MLKRVISILLLLAFSGTFITGCVTVNKDSQPQPAVTVESGD